MNDAQALKKVAGGSERALAKLIDRYAAYVHAIVGGILGAHLSAEDTEKIESDVFFALWNNAAKIQPDRLKSWLGAVARNAAKSRLRGLGHEFPLEEDALKLVAPENDFLRREQQAFVRKAVLQMDEPDREIFLRHYFYGQTVNAIAAAMNMNPSTVKSRLSRRREKLQFELYQNF